MEGKITGTGKRIMTMMLSVIMVTGIFAGIKLDVRAADYSFDLSSPCGFTLATEKTYYSNDTLVFTGFTLPPAGNTYEYEIRLDYYANLNFSRRIDCGRNLRTISISFPNDSQYDYAKFIDYERSAVSPGGTQVVTLVFNMYGSFTPSQPTAAHSTESSAAPSHECSFQWVTTVEPQPGIDGLEEYQCMSCGMVKESQPIPASMATVKNLYGFIKDAPENGNVTIDFGKLHTISDYLLNKMSERSDVTVTISFEYQSAQYEITFPSGTDYSAVLEDEDTMYGYFGVAARLGLTVEAK